jgi:hypothetical protein
VQLGQPAALAVGQQQVDRAEQALELLLDAVAQRVDALAGQGADEDRFGVAEAELAAALVGQRVGLVEHEQRRALAGADVVEHVLDGVLHLHQVVLVGAGVDDVDDEVGQPRLLQRGAEGLDELVGSLRMKPTVSVSRYGRPLRRSWRVLGSSVWNSRSRTPTVAPVIWLSSVDLPALV